MTIQLTLSVFDRLNHVQRYTKKGSLLDRQRIRSYATWILYNLRLPILLSSDILLGDSSWILFDNSSAEITNERPNTGHVVHGRHTPTPHSVVAIIPTLRMAFVQAFYIPEEINRVEAIAVLCVGLQWAASEFQESGMSFQCLVRQCSGGGYTHQRDRSIMEAPRPAVPTSYYSTWPQKQHL